MKNSIIKKSVFIVMLALLGTMTTNAQKVGNLVFLKGQYLEVGVAECGVFGNLDSSIIPPGYHARSENEGLGFVADPDQDGFNVGTPDYCGDYFTPGTPVEGWFVEFNGTSYGNNWSDCSSRNDIAADVSKTTYTNTVNNVSATWEGNVSGLNVKKTTSFPKNGLYFVTHVTLTNNSPSTMTNVYYMRNVDPDNEQPITGDYTTDNTIVNQPTAVDSSALVEAVGLVHGCYIGLGTLDKRARVSHGGFNNTDASDVYNGIGYNTGIGANKVADEAISLAFYLGNLLPNQSVSFAYAYVLEASQLGVAFGAIVNPPQFLVGGVNVTGTDTAEICPGEPVDIEITNGNAYTWTWAPGTDLSSTTGTLVTANLTAAQRTYTITGISATDTVVKVITLKAVGIPTLSAANLIKSIGDAPFVLNHATPGGGTYSGPGVSAGNMFSPAVAGLGTHAIEYKYTVGAGCTDSITFNITVNSGSDSCDLACPSDASWSLSSVVTPTNLSGMWSGVAGVLPAAATFTLPVQVGQPFPWNHIGQVGSADPIKSGAHITYYRKTFNLTTTSGIEARLRLNVDDQAEIYVNGTLLARIDAFGPANRKNPHHDVRLYGVGLADNGYSGGDSYDYVSGMDISTVFQVGANDVIVVVRNLGKSNAKGGFAFQMDLSGCSAIPKSAEATVSIVAEAPSLKVYPNPNNGQFTVEFDSFDTEKEINLTIADLKGQQIRKVNVMDSGQMNLDISTLPSGVYLLKVSQGDIQYSEKIIKY